MYKSIYFGSMIVGGIGSSLILFSASPQLAIGIFMLVGAVFIELANEICK